MEILNLSLTPLYLIYCIIVSILTYIFVKILRFWTINKITENIDETIFNEKHLDVSSYGPGQLQDPFPNTWYAVIQSRDLKAGQVKPLYVLEKYLVAYRTMTGEAHILDAYCPHQGANLGVGGSVVDDNIRCPFHNWEFNGEGICTAVPGLQDSKLPKATIKKWHTFEINNWVYIWYDKDDNDPIWTPPKLPGIDSVTFERQIEIDVNCHIMDLYGNSFDVDHLDGLHSMSGFVSDQQVLTRGTFYHLVKKIIRLKVYNKFIYEESENKRWVEIDNRSIPVLFGIPLDWMAITGTLIFCPNVIYARWNFTNLNIKFNTLLSNIPISALKWHILNTAYHDNSGFLSKLMARFAIAYFKGQVMPEYIILNNKRFLKTPHMTVLDKPQAKFFRWMSDNYYNSKSQ